MGFSVLPPDFAEELLGMLWVLPVAVLPEVREGLLQERKVLRLCPLSPHQPSWAGSPALPGLMEPSPA